MLNNAIDQQLLRSIIIWCKFEGLEAVGKGIAKEVGLKR
jgi:hypothetical protein